MNHIYAQSGGFVVKLTVTDTIGCKNINYIKQRVRIAPKPIFSLENKLFTYLGKISYGLYMFHPLAIICAVKICLVLNYTKSILVYPLTVAVAIVLAALSYQFFEKYFIKKKVKYSAVVSGDNVK